MKLESFIKKLKESEEFRKFNEEMGLEETSVTGMVAGYETPKAFSPSKKKFEKQAEKNAEEQGYEVVSKTSKKNYESVYKQAMSLMNEATYKEFRGDESRSTNRKINDSIKNINRTIYEVERVVEHALKLKTEMNVDQRTLWGESMSRLRKISERINRITKKIHELGA
jgi:hypothetical protein